MPNHPNPTQTSCFEQLAQHEMEDLDDLNKRLTMRTLWRTPTVLIANQTQTMNPNNPNNVMCLFSELTHTML